MEERMHHRVHTDVFQEQKKTLPRVQGKKIRSALAWLHMRKVFLLLIALILAEITAFATLYYPSYVVTINGVEIGKVEQKENYEQAAAQVEEQVSEILGRPYHFAAEPSFQHVYTYGNEYISSSAMEQQLLNTVDEIERLYVLRIDGSVVGAYETMDPLVDLLHQVMEPYQDEATQSIQFVEPISIRQEYVSKTTTQDLAQMLQTLQAEQGTDRTHEVQAGDTLASIAQQYNCSAEVIAELNPGLTEETLSSYSSIMIEEKAPLLSVYVEKTSSYTEEIPYETKTVSDSTLYKGEQKVKTAGVKGVKQVTESQTWKNDRLISRTVTEENVTQAPVAEVIAVGTKERPKTTATGSFAWPTSGKITSPFGYRYIFGSTSFHSGIDIANQCGTAIKAADGGTVTFAGYKGTYGKLVIINHENGKQTYYAHCSQILVSQGGKVSKGQQIARMGATGRATGNHLHFEIRVNGKAVNPLSYL